MSPDLGARFPEIWQHGIAADYAGICRAELALPKSGRNPPCAPLYPCHRLRILIPQYNPPMIAEIGMENGIN